MAIHPIVCGSGELKVMWVSITERTSHLQTVDGSYTQRTRCIPQKHSPQIVPK